MATATPSLSQWIDSLPLTQETLDALYAVAYEFYRNGKYDEAKTAFHLLAVADPNDFKFWKGLGASYQLLKRYDSAVEAYGVAATLHCTDPYTHLHAAECLFHQGKMEKAIQALDSAKIVAEEIEADSRLIAKLDFLMETWTILDSADQDDASQDCVDLTSSITEFRILGVNDV